MNESVIVECERVVCEREKEQERETTNERKFMVREFVSDDPLCFFPAFRQHSITSNIFFGPGSWDNFTQPNSRGSTDQQNLGTLATTVVDKLAHLYTIRIELTVCEVVLSRQVPTDLSLKCSDFRDRVQLPSNSSPTMQPT